MLNNLNSISHIGNILKIIVDNHKTERASDDGIKQFNTCSKAVCKWFIEARHSDLLGTVMS